MNIRPLSRTEAGNALFLILIAVALFAALSYAITQSGRGSGSIGKEQNIIAAAQLTQVGAAVKATVTRMLLTGTTHRTLKLNNGTTCSTSLNNMCTSGADCAFSSEGGGVILPTLPPNIGTINLCLSDNTNTDWGRSVKGLGQDASGTPPTGSGFDFYIAFDGTSVDVCTAINKALGINGIPNLDVSSHVIDMSVDAPGHEAFCFQFGPGPNDRTYMQIVSIE